MVFRWRKFQPSYRANYSWGELLRLGVEHFVESSFNLRIKNETIGFEIDFWGWLSCINYYNENFENFGHASNIKIKNELIIFEMNFGD